VSLPFRSVLQHAKRVGDDLTNTDAPFEVAIHQIAGAFAQLEKLRPAKPERPGLEWSRWVRSTMGQLAAASCTRASAAGRKLAFQPGVLISKLAARIDDHPEGVIGPVQYGVLEAADQQLALA
jgi:hypothetical protein